MTRYNAGYEIVETLSFSDHHFALGHNPKAPAAYVTWETSEKLEAFFRGHYFTDKEDAILDLFQRAGRELHLAGHKSLGIGLLTEQDLHDMRQEFRNENAREDIAVALAEELDCHREENYDLEALLKDPAFMDKAIRLYDNLDHGYENEALRDELSYLLEEFPQHHVNTERKDLTAEVRISPEMNDLIKDLLNMPTAAVAEKYGPLGDNYEFVFSFDNDVEAIISVRPAYDLNDPNKLSTVQPHSMHLEAYDEDGSLICSDVLTEKDWTSDPDKGGIAGQCQISLYDDMTLTLSLQEDESLRRLGNRFTYRPNTEDERYQEHAGDVCTIIRALTPDEADILITGLMWEAEFPNSANPEEPHILHVFDGELELPEPVQSRKPPLAQQITDAQEKSTFQSQNEERKQPER